MNFGRTVSFVCVYLFSMPLYLGSARVTKVNLDNYFTDSNYNCYTQSSDLYKKPKNHIRRCKNAYTSETYSTRCIFCPIPCSFCGTPLKDYSFDKIVDESRPKRNCIFHSIHTIHPIKIRSRKGVTDERTVKCTVKDFCKENPCLNEGTCFNEFYSYSCICQEGFNGKNCARKTESSLKGQLTNGLSVWFPLEVVAGRLFPFFVSLYHADKDQVIEISTAQGYTTVIKKENEIKNFEERCKQLKSGDCRCKSCRFGYSGTLLADNYYLKANFDRLPMFTDDLNILGFVSNITVRMYNQVLRTSDGKPYYMDTISSFKTLRIQQVYRSGLFPNCDCSVFAVNEQIRSGYCSAEYLKSPLINSNVQSEFYFQPYFVEFGWQLKKNPGDSRSMLEVGGRFYKKSQASSCFKYEIEYRWRVYKVSTLYRMSDANEDRLAVADFCEFPNQNRKLSEKCTANKRVLQNLPEGHYMVRLTLLTTSFSNTRSIVDNCQSNYVCYFNLKAPKKQFHIDNPSMKDCKASIDTKGFVKNDGYLMWKCTAKTGGPCPPKLASTTRPYLDNVQFYEGEYEICVQYNNNEGVTVGDDCTTLKAENCDEDNDKPDYVIICKDNCLTNPDPTIPFRGGVIDRRHGGNAPKEVTYKVIDSNGKDVPLETIRIHKGVRKNELKIDLSKLNPKERYQIIGTVPNPDGGEPYETPPYDLIYTVADIPKDGNCTISPKEGIKGVSLFDIECFGWQSEGTILYEFFDKSPEDTAHYAGRMIGFSYSGILSKFRLTRGRVVIYLVNEDGEGPMVQFNVTLSDFNSNMTHIEYLMNESDGYVAYNNFHATMDVMSTTSEILYHGLNNDFYLRKILTTMNKVTYDSAESVKLGISTLLSILVNATSNGTYKLNDGLEVAVGEILLKLAQRYLYFATKPDLTPRLRAKFINELTRNMMGCVDMTMIAQDKNVSKLDPEQEVDYDVIDNWNTASNNIAEALMIAMYLVGRAHVYADPGVHLPSSANVTDMYAYVYDAEGLVDIAGNNISSYVRISPELASTFDPNHDIMLQFALMNKNLFWWQKGNINSELIMVGLAEKLYRPGYYYVPRVEAPLQILLKVKNQENTTVSGVTTQLDKELDEDTLDRILLVHRFILPPLSKLFIKFSFNDSSAPSLRVQVLFDERPTWESISSGAVIVNASNSTVELPYEDVEREHFYYMAILPDSNVTVNESVEYSFNLNYINCHIWENQWTNHYCLIGPNTTEETVECLCTHLSIFSSTIFIPPNDINPILDAPLFLSVYTNPWVALFVLLILILFLLLIIWAFKKDRQDALRSEVIVLHDNFPGERCAYLIAIFTGSRLTSSTSAAVGLRLYGELYASRATVLMSDKRKVLQRDSDDWFLLCYPVPLGTLNAVQLWHDNSGKSPDWFCSKIIVYDIDAKTQYLFIVDQWVAMEVNEFPEAMVRPATSDEILGVKRIFVDNSVSGLRENHLFLGVLARHPRSPVARKERLVVLMVLLMTAMLASIMFFEMSDEFDYTVDDYTYNVGEREIIIAIQSCIISALFAFIAMILFRKSYTCTEEEKPKNIDSTLYMPTKRSVDSDIYWRSKKPAFVDLSTFVAYHEAPEKPRREMTMYETFVASIKKCSHHNVIRPVRLTEGEEQEIQVHREWLVAAWVFSFSVIFISAYIVMLYSLKFGKNKSLRWLSSLVLAELLDILLFTPIKIFLIAMLLSASFERSTDNLTFKLDVQKATKSDLVGNQEYLDELLKKREASTYNPMTDKVKAEKRRAAIRRMKWRLFCDFVAVATFILVLCYIVSILWSSAHYHPNHHAGNIVMTTFHGRFVALHDVFNRTLFLSYLENTFVRSLFTFRWFNNLKFETLSPQGNSSNITERKDWTKDYVSKLMGAPRLRQLRVVHNLCTTYQMRLMAIEECIKPWDPSYMDTEVYGIRWRKAELEDELAYSWGHRTSWMYHLAKNTSVFPLPGKSGIVYPSGGYILPLTVKRDTSRSYALSVRQDNWIDQRSRGIFLEFTLYNVNTNLFSQVTAIVEQMSSGLFMPTVFVQSVHTYGDWSVMNVIYVIFIVILFIEIAYNINRNGLLNFSLKFLHVYEVVVIIVGILSVVFYLIHVKVSTFYVDDFRRTGQDQFFKFSDMIKYFLYTRVLLWILFCLLVFRLFFSWYFGPAYVFYYRTFVLSKREIAIFVVALFFYFYIIWRYIGYTIDAAVFYNYQVNILHYKMYTHIHYRTSLTRTRRLAMALCFLALFFKLMYFVVFMHYYLIAKRKKLFPMHHLNFIEFLIYETKKASGKIKEEQPTSDRQIHRKRDM